MEHRFSNLPGKLNLVGKIGSSKIGCKNLTEQIKGKQLLVRRIGVRTVFSNFAKSLVRGHKASSLPSLLLWKGRRETLGTRLQLTEFADIYEYEKTIQWNNFIYFKRYVYLLWLQITHVLCDTKMALKLLASPYKIMNWI